MTGSMGSVIASTAGGAAAAIAQAIKACGVIVRVEPQEFLAILARAEAPLVVTARGGLFSKNYQYLTSYKGLAFFAKSSDPLELPASVEVIRSSKIWIPA